jgi:outer membrane protein TolC
MAVYATKAARDKAVKSAEATVTRLEQTVDKHAKGLETATAELKIAREDLEHRKTAPVRSEE